MGDGIPLFGERHVACAILVQEGKILLGRRSPHDAICPDLWDIFGGHVEAGESPAQALVREIQEELGVVAEEFAELETILECRTELGGPVAMHLYLVKRSNRQIKMLGDEHTELRWFTIQETCCLPDLAHPEYSDIFQAISR